MRVLLFCLVLATTPLLAAEPAATPVRLDLRPPDIHDVWTPQQIATVLQSTQDPDVLVENVEVQGFRGTAAPRTPTVWSGLGAPFWALLHPAQAWRILLPLPPDQTSVIAPVEQPYLTVAAQDSELRAGL
jgi:hypothetical protein